MNQQGSCLWPSAKKIKDMTSRNCHRILEELDLDGPEADGMDTNELRGAIRQLKRQSHLNGDHSCNAAGEIQRQARREANRSQENRSQENRSQERTAGNTQQDQRKSQRVQDERKTGR